MVCFQFAGEGQHQSWNQEEIGELNKKTTSWKIRKCRRWSFSVAFGTFTQRRRWPEPVVGKDSTGRRRLVVPAVLGFLVGQTVLAVPVGLPIPVGLVVPEVRGCLRVLAVQKVPSVPVVLAVQQILEIPCLLEFRSGRLVLGLLEFLGFRLVPVVLGVQVVRCFLGRRRFRLSLGYPSVPRVLVGRRCRAVQVVQAGSIGSRRR